jgi:hypothetical protein
MDTRTHHYTLLPTYLTQNRCLGTRRIFPKSQTCYLLEDTYTVMTPNKTRRFHWPQYLKRSSILGTHLIIYRTHPSPRVLYRHRNLRRNIDTSYMLQSLRFPVGHLEGPHIPTSASEFPCLSFPTLKYKQVSINMSKISCTSYLRT